MSLELLRDALRRLSPAITEHKRARIASVVAARTNSVSLLLENVHDEANVNAVLRSMDALGCLHLHRLTTSPPSSRWLEKRENVRKRCKYPPRTDSGARSWVSMRHWDNARECVERLREKHGYLLACASHEAATCITDIDFNQKLLIAFGNETDGISDELAGLSDVQFSVPMCGFVESYNISVAASLTLYHAYLHRIRNHVTGGDLTEREQLEWTCRYYMKCITKDSDPFTYGNDFESQRSPPQLPKGYEELHHLLTDTM